MAKSGTRLRGYGTEHQRLRKRWAVLVERGEVICARSWCQKPILPGEAWDLGHDDNDRSVYTGPEHAKCNRGAPKKLQAIRSRRKSRAW